MWLRRRALSASRGGRVGEEFVVIDLDAVAQTFGRNGIDGNSHGKPRRRQENSFDQKKDLEGIEPSRLSGVPICRSEPARDDLTGTACIRQGESSLKSIASKLAPTGLDPDQLPLTGLPLTVPSRSMMLYSLPSVSTCCRRTSR
ncbi:hypothetical protein D3C76_1305720 [compost metagenome]